MTPDTVELLKRWKKHVKKYTASSFTDQISGWNQNLIEPYVLHTRVLTYDIGMLICTSDAKAWWDQIAIWSDLIYISQLGMIRPGDTVFDLGASHGFYSVVLSKMAGPAGRVYAFEPFSLLADNVRFNAELNNSPIQVFEVGLSNEKKPARASLTHQCIGIDSGPYAVDINLDTLDNYAHLNPSFLKIDIEGAEINALQGATALLARRPNIHIEVHTSYFQHFGKDADDLLDLLPWDGYTTYIQYPGRAFEPYRREYKLEQHCALFMLNHEPVRRVYS